MVRSAKPSRRPPPRLPLPGPKAAAVLKQAERSLSLIRPPLLPLVAQHAQGCWVFDPDGNAFLDMGPSGGLCTVGHSHPRVRAAIERQAHKLQHFSGRLGYQAIHAELCTRLAGLDAVRGPEPRVMLGQSGSDAVRAAIDLARFKTGRDAVVAFVATLHDPDLDSLSMPTNKLVELSGLGPLVSGMHHASFPDPLRQGDEATSQALEDVFNLLGKVVSTDNVAAMLVEPIQEEGGYRIPPDQFLAALRRLCDQHGMLLIANEIHTGLGRTGKMFGWQHTGAQPDIVCLAGGMASGLPLGAVIARSELTGWPSHTQPSTFGGSPLACAAALATLDLLEKGLVDKAARAGAKMLKLVRDAVGDHPSVGEVRGRGLIVAIELVHDRNSFDPAPELRSAVVRGCFERGLLVNSCGASAVALTPPLVVNDAELALGAERFAAALAAATTQAEEPAQAASSSESPVSALQNAVAQALERRSGMRPPKRPAAPRAKARRKA